MKFMLNQQNPELDDDDGDELMARVLGKQSSITLLPSSASTHNLNLDYHDPKVQFKFILLELLVYLSICVGCLWLRFVILPFRIALHLIPFC